MKRLKQTGLAQMKLTSFCVKKRKSDVVDEECEALVKKKKAVKENVEGMIKSSVVEEADVCTESGNVAKKVVLSEVVMNQENTERFKKEKMAVLVEVLANKEASRDVVKDTVVLENQVITNEFVEDDLSWVAGLDDLVEEDFNDTWWNRSYEIDLEKPSLCMVAATRVEAEGSRRAQVLLVELTQSKSQGKCRLEDVWAYSQVAVGDEVTVCARKMKGDWVVDAGGGYVSLHPAVLISSTTLTGAMFCLRRGVLANYFRGLDQGCKAMTVGQIVHEMLQTCLSLGSCEDTVMKQSMDDAIHRNLRDLHSSDLTIQATHKELAPYLIQIKKFMEVYVQRKNPPSQDNYTGFINEVVDIEEDLTAAKLGLKGRIDVTVRVAAAAGGVEKLMPLELKTGMASFSNSHKAQVALYTMMMTEAGNEVDSGLLLYLKQGTLKQLTPTRVEQRDLLLLRNQFVRWLKNFRTNQTLPEPIRSKTCTSCPYLNVCATYLKQEGLENLGENHPMRSTSDLTLPPHHLDYFMFWSKLLFLENCEEEGGSKKCSLGGLMLTQDCIEYKGEFKHTFQRSDRADTLLTPGSFVTVSTPSHRHMCYGKVVSITPEHCSVLVDKNLNKSKQETFQVVLYQSNAILSVSLTNLATLLDEPYQQLRSIVIDKTLPVSHGMLGKSTLTEECLKVLKPLNADQRRAVLKVLTAKDYLIIRGPPGTGKTQTLVTLIKLLSILKQSVLIVGHTHSSVDNILLRLPPDLDYVRIGSLRSVHPEVHSRTLVTLLRECKTTEDVQRIYDCNIMASTCLGLDTNVMAKRKFDLCLVDESSQALQPEVLRPLFCSNKFVLIGDSKQLAPVVKNRDALKAGLAESLFERLEQPDSTLTLQLQYRMNQTLTDLANKLIYEGMLRCGSEAVAEAVLNMDASLLARKEEWLQRVLSVALDMSVVFLDTSEYFELHPDTVSDTCRSHLEASLVKKLVETLVQGGVPAQSIGVMAPYRSQVELLKQTLASWTVEVNTVDQYQGRDKEVVIYSCTKENKGLAAAPDQLELMNNQRRLTVAVTRAKHKLVVVGDRATIVRYSPLARLLSCLQPTQLLRLQQDMQGFCFQRTLLP